MKIAGKQQPADSPDVPPPLPSRTYSKRVSIYMCMYVILINLPSYINYVMKTIVHFIV